MEPIQSIFPLSGAIESRIGGRSENQDYYGCRDTAIGTVIVVCDGMGGMQGGQVASMLAVNSILNSVEAEMPDADPADALFKAIRKANFDIIQTGTDNPNLYGMGTTVTALLLTPQCATVAYVGDSRVYQLRGRCKKFRTFDHSVVFEMVKNGVLTEEQARLSDQSNVILKALGIFPEIDPDIYKLPYEKGDRFVLCSDGFWGCLPEKELLKMITGGKDLNQVLMTATDRADTIGHNKGGNHDNLTVALVEMNSNSLMKEKMSKSVKVLLAVLTVLLLVSLTANAYLATQLFGEQNKTEQIQPAESKPVSEAGVSTDVDATTEADKSGEISEAKAE